MSKTVDLGDDEIVCAYDLPKILDAGTGYESYLWSTGATTQAIGVTVEGTYSVTVFR